MGEIFTVQGDEFQNVAGALVYWSLTGYADMQDLGDALEAEGLDRDALPPAPTFETVLHRAASAAASGGKRQMVRPLKGRGAYVFVTELVVEQDGKERLELQHHVEMRVVREGDSRKMLITPITPEDEGTAQKIAVNVNLFTGLMTTHDVSAWLLDVVAHVVKGVSLRERGGIYFIPRDRMDLWRRYVRALRAASRHTVFEIPAMRTDDAVEAILTALRAESDAELGKLDEYLKGDVTPRGLKGCERDLAAVQSKLAHYANLLQVQLPDVVARVERVTGAIAAARLNASDNPVPGAAAV